jgi:hypothetical protein
MPDPTIFDTVETTEPIATVTSIGNAATGGRFYQHPGIILAGVVFTTAFFIGHASRPLVKAKASGKAGPAKGSIEGEI